MILPKLLFLNAAKEKEIFYFSTDKINSAQAHYFICIKKGLNEIMLFTCCTTQKEKRERYLQLKNYPLTTLVYIQPSSTNGLKEDTWVDCNSFFSFTSEEFTNLCTSNKIEFKGEVSDIYYEQILVGLHASPAIEESAKMSFPNTDNIL